MTSQNFLLGRSNSCAYASGYIILAQPIKMAKTPSQAEDRVKMKALVTRRIIANILCMCQVNSLRPNQLRWSRTPNLVEYQVKMKVMRGTVAITS